MIGFDKILKSAVAAEIRQNRQRWIAEGRRLERERGVELTLWLDPDGSLQTRGIVDIGLVEGGPAYTGILIPLEDDQ